jgi:hypothetical protein
MRSFHVAPGWAKGEVLMTLAPEGAGTRLAANGQAQIGGTIAGVGQRMMEGVARAMAPGFFKSIEMQGRREPGLGAGLVLADRQRHVADHSGASITDRSLTGVGG